jgi:probable rRNA maturation factor
VLDVTVDPGAFPDAPVPLLERAVQHTLQAEGLFQAEVSVALLADPDIRELNRRHLGHDAVTDVISFALHEIGEPVLGDVYLGAEQARRQAEEEGVAEVEELVRLAVHGTLHVLGWDHPEDAGARVRSPMWQRQERLVAEVLAAI